MNDYIFDISREACSGVQQKQGRSFPALSSLAL
jgi:hypothetical protein